MRIGNGQLTMFGEHMSMARVTFAYANPYILARGFRQEAVVAGGKTVQGNKSGFHSNGVKEIM